jgi:hypothetical protein
MAANLAGEMADWMLEGSNRWAGVLAMRRAVFAAALAPTAALLLRLWIDVSLSEESPARSLSEGVVLQCSEAESESLELLDEGSFGGGGCFRLFRLGWSASVSPSVCGPVYWRSCERSGRGRVGFGWLPRS